MSHLLNDHHDWPNAMTTPTPRVERVENETSGTPCLVRYMIELPKRIAKLEAERDSLKRHADAMAFVGEEYWNRGENSGAMLDALDKLDEAIAAYRAAHHDGGAK